LLLAVVGVVVVVIANVALLGFATERNDPVGRLQPITALGSSNTVPEAAPTAPGGPTTTGDDEPNGHDGSSAGDGRDD
jgi:hypothetical protein